LQAGDFLFWVDDRGVWRGERHFAVWVTTIISMLLFVGGSENAGVEV
jgi:hypothetical protein